jgi:excinuclease UvrABC helicase subunit UvrB
LIASQKKLAHERNRERDILRSRQHYYENKEIYLARTRKRYRDNPEKNAEHSKAWAVANPEKRREINRKYNRKYRSTPKGNLSSTMSKRINESLKKGMKAGRHWETLVDFTIDQLKDHLEKMFTNEMSWDNYGEWHIDHILPIAAFNFEIPEDIDFKQCW